MNYIKCPKCELNYIDADKEKICLTCREEEIKKTKLRSIVLKSLSVIKAPVRYNGRAIFFVFQNNKEFLNESKEGIIQAPHYDKGMNEPHHWVRLLNVKKGDVILHGVDGLVLAISEAEGLCYNFFYKDGRQGRKVDCKYQLLTTPLVTAKYKKEIIDFCPNYEYQPFNKNGTGNQGYLFDKCREIAKLFISDIVAHNPDIESLLAVKEILFKLNQNKLIL